MPRTATDWTGYRYSFLEILGPSTITDSHGRRKLNTRNQRRSKYVEYKGQRVNASELAERLGINYTTLLYRLEHDCPVDHLADAPDVRNRFTMS